MAGSDEVLEALSDNRLPENFWNDEVAEENLHLAEVHTSLISRLQQESPDADVLELMMMERVCTLYIYMRMFESKDAFEFDKTYKEMMQLWVSMAADLRKTRIRAEEVSSIRMGIVTEISKVLNQALVGVDPKIANKVKTHLITLVA